MSYRDIEERRSYGRKWIAAHPEKAREAMRRWRARHPEEHKADGRAFYAKHAEREVARSRLYQQAHPWVHREVLQRRRARQNGAAGTYTTQEWSTLVALYDARCAYCGVHDVLVPDHGVPLKRGGFNRIENIYPACSPCNAHKHTLTVEEYRERRRRAGLYVRPPLRREGTSGPWRPFVASGPRSTAAPSPRRP
ncbi:MAG: HNH endonuclease [Chloroflexota bacterium]|nr:HNH endonuclease [Chloroflexota bacterium]